MSNRDDNLTEKARVILQDVQSRLAFDYPTCQVVRSESHPVSPEMQERQLAFVLATLFGHFGLAREEWRFLLHHGRLARGAPPGGIMPELVAAIHALVMLLWPDQVGGNRE
jgi:hypothetical protein